MFAGSTRVTSQPLRWIVVLAVALALVAAACSGGVDEAADAGSDAGAGDGPPNIVFILLDDLRALDLEQGFGLSLEDWDSTLGSELIDGGMWLDNFILTTPLCCPSRASFLTGRYSHSHGIWGNNYVSTDENGGLRRFFEQGYEEETVADWLQEAGYYTGIVGKYLNGFPNKPDDFVSETYIPPGWDEAYITFIRAAEFSFYEFNMGENGAVVDYGVDQPAYLTDVERDHAVDFLQRVAPGDQPFFLYLSPYSPHGPVEAAYRHVGLHDDVFLPTPESHNETDLSDKPEHVAAALTFEVGTGETATNEPGHGQLRRLDMTLSVDELLRAVFDELEQQGVLDNTYVFFASDNGVIFGEHAIWGKSLPYEEAIRVPMLVRGPGIEAGSTSDLLAGNIDLAPTFLDLAGVGAPDSVDGESLAPVLQNTVTAEDWRDAILIEMLTIIESPNLEDRNVVVPRYAGVRTPRYTYVEWDTGERELYDLQADPHQLDSIHATSPDILSDLEPMVDALRACSSAGCAAGARRDDPNLPGVEHDCRQGACTFRALPATGHPGTVQSYRWDFGDGAVGEGETAEHVYAAAGQYPVTLTVEYDSGPLSTVRVVGIGALSSGTMLVSDILVAPRSSSEIAFRVEVVDDISEPVVGATVRVKVTVNGAAPASRESDTNDRGRAGFFVAKLEPGDIVELCVTDVVHGELSLDAAGSEQLCTESGAASAG